MVRVIHLRESLFMVGYIDGVVELRDFEKDDQPSMIEFNAHENCGEENLGAMMDFCCKSQDESKVMMCF